MKKALIIGANGFVGGYLAEQLKENYDVYGTKLKDEEWNLPEIPFLILDIMEKEQIESLLRKMKPEYIYHLAAQSSVSLSWKNPQLTIDINIKGSVNLLEAVRNLDYSPRILLVGSGEEYGYVNEDELPINEGNPLRPGNIYAATKASQNLLGNIYSRAYGLDIVMVRSFNHMGPKQTETFVVSDFCRQVVEIESGEVAPVIQVGNLLAKRDFTDVRDVVRAYELLMVLGEKGETYNVGRGKAISIREILDIILSCTKIKIEIMPVLEKMRPLDVPIIVADRSKITKTTGWEPKIDLKQTIVDTLDYWRRQKGESKDVN